MSEKEVAKRLSNEIKLFGRPLSSSECIVFDKTIEMVEKMILRLCGDYGLDIPSRTILEELKELKGGKIDEIK